MHSSTSRLPLLPLGRARYRWHPLAVLAIAVHFGRGAAGQAGRRGEDSCGSVGHKHTPMALLSSAYPIPGGFRWLVRWHNGGSTRPVPVAVWCVGMDGTGCPRVWQVSCWVYGGGLAISLAEQPRKAVQSILTPHLQRMCARHSAAPHVRPASNLSQIWQVPPSLACQRGADSLSAAFASLAVLCSACLWSPFDVSDTTLSNTPPAVFSSQVAIGSGKLPDSSSLFSVRWEAAHGALHCFCDPVS
ncbi:hypothetical protein B0T26DRAFT_82787 [Lasiosphaeria miniovina]|uniref:Uncharacterized protein n=1 Tax=Lasiosphaeria miniovina TaxID=1954250 RepID=A0AA40BIH7_9PEZI|nr:uncharacterized protein B0T26DRAFT_82787 [Lasiosphaeria miniovina]KAK0734830.1 hypothetical protein B0T26DRAFT_82787 [Lasiosphaeria miniovina]